MYAGLCWTCAGEQHFSLGTLQRCLRACCGTAVLARQMMPVIHNKVGVVRNRSQM
jgi:hypothetical protein